MMTSSPIRLVILYGIGGLSDVGRHAILAAMEYHHHHGNIIEKITVITEYPEKLNEINWDCGCLGGHTNPFNNDNDDNNKNVLELVKINSWKDNDNIDLLKEHLQHEGTTVISCLGHRQPGKKYPELITKGLIAYDGNKQLIQAMEEQQQHKEEEEEEEEQEEDNKNITTKATAATTTNNNNNNNNKRVVVISSFALQNSPKSKSWPHFASTIMRCIFLTFARKAKNDLEAMEELYIQSSSLDYLFVRPVGIGEDVVPVGKYFLQEPGNKKVVVGGNMAKMDVARFMVEQAINPTFHRMSKTVGAEPGTPM